MSRLSESRVLDIMGKYGNAPQQLIAILLDVQEASGNNCVDREWAGLIAKTLDVPLAKIYETLTFYAMFSTAPRGEYLVEICQSTPCDFDKAEHVVAWFESALGVAMGQSTADGKFTLMRTSCVGACDCGPVAKIGDEVFGDLTEEKVRAIVAACRDGNLERMGELAC